MVTRKRQLSMSTTLRRSLCYVLTAAMAISGTTMLPHKAGKVNAATKEDLPITPGAVLSDGMIYYVDSDTEIISTNGRNGLEVAADATTIIFIEDGATLTVEGGDGRTGNNGQTGGGAGIYVPEGSTLIVTGEGKLNVTGGDGGTAQSGSNGSAGNINNQGMRGGQGGRGGFGAGGAGAAIGTRGGQGADRPDAQAQESQGNSEANGTNGNDGIAGEASKAAGDVYILGEITLNASAGEAKVSSAVGGSNGNSASRTVSGNHYYAGAGGGGGAGGTTLVAATIGSGAPGAGSGGNGGSGGRATSDTSEETNYKNGTGGKGGIMNGGDGSTNTDGIIAGGGSAGKAGDMGEAGEAGKVYIGSKVTIERLLNNYSGTDDESKKTGYGNSSERTDYTLEEETAFLKEQGISYSTDINLFDDTEDDVSDVSFETTINGKPAKKVLIPVEKGLKFKGYYADDTDEIQIYDEYGKIVKNVSGYTDENGAIIYPYDLTLYAHWAAKYSISFDTNAEEDAVKPAGTSSLVVSEGDKIENINIPVREDYVFLGYFDNQDYTSEDATQVFNEDGSVTTGTAYVDETGAWIYAEEQTEITLYAHWAAKYSISFDTNAEEDAVKPAGTSSLVVSAGDKIENISIPAREDYAFLGYFDNQDYTSEDATQVFNEDGSVTTGTAYVDETGAWIYAEEQTEITLYAAWVKDIYKDIIQGMRRFEDYSDAKMPSDLSNHEKEVYNNSVDKVLNAISELEDKGEIDETIAEGKEYIDQTIEIINRARSLEEFRIEVIKELDKLNEKIQAARKNASEADKALIKDLVDAANEKFYEFEDIVEEIREAETVEDIEDGMISSLVAFVEMAEAVDTLMRGVTLVECNNALTTADKAIAELKNDPYASADSINAVEAAKKAAKAAVDTAKSVGQDYENAMEEYKEASKAYDEAVEIYDNLDDDAPDEEVEAAEEAMNEAAEEMDEAGYALQKAEDKLYDALNEVEAKVALIDTSIADAKIKAAEAKGEAEKAAQLLQEAKDSAKDKVDAFYAAKRPADYRTAQQKELEAAKEAAKKAIDAAKNTDEINKAVTDALKTMNDVKTDTDLYKAETAASNTYKAELEDNCLKISAGLKVTQSGKKLNVQWGAVAGAEEYRVYAQYSDKDFADPVAVIKTGETKATITKVGGKKINKKKLYKVYVEAYKTINGKLTNVGYSITGYVAGAKNAKYTNIKKLTLKSKPSVTLSIGKVSTIKVKATLSKKKKKPMTKGVSKFRYVSSNKNVAKVGTNGEITGVGEGTCTVYVYAPNGISKQITVTVQ